MGRQGQAGRGRQGQGLAGRRLLPLSPAARAGLPAPAARHPPRTCHPPLQTVQGGQYRAGSTGQYRAGRGDGRCCSWAGCGGWLQHSRARVVTRPAGRQMHPKRAGRLPVAAPHARARRAPASRATSHSVPMASTLAGYFSSSPRRFSWTCRGGGRVAACMGRQAGAGRQAGQHRVDSEEGRQKGGGLESWPARSRQPARHSRLRSAAQPVLQPPGPLTSPPRPSQPTHPPQPASPPACCS